MNKPATVQENWCWRLTPGALTEDLGRRLRDVTIAAKRGLEEKVRG
jgi:4-alpha-glucanotransferase